MAHSLPWNVGIGTSILASPGRLGSLTPMRDMLEARRPLGRSGLTVPRIALGCGNFGGIGSAPELFGQGLSEDQAFALMDAAWEFGLTHFDTADAYGGGRSELSIGRWIASRGVRPQLTTKTYNPMAAGADHGLRPERIARQLSMSLDRLGVDRVELYLAHDFDPEVPLAESFGALDQGQAEGMIGAYGVSNFDAGPAGRRAGGGRAAGRPEQLLAAGSRGRRGTARAVRRAGRRLPGLQPAGRRLADRQVPARRAVPGRVADDPASRALPGVRHRTGFRRPWPAAGRGRVPRYLDGRTGAGLAARRRTGDAGRDRARAALSISRRCARRCSIR